MKFFINRNSFGISRVAILATMLSVCISAGGCSLSLHGRQTVQNGEAVTVTGSRIQGSAALGGQGRVSFSSGSVPPAGSSGGQLTLSRGATALVVAGAILSGLAQSWRSTKEAPRPSGDGTIMPSCSCFRQAEEPPAQ